MPWNRSLAAIASLAVAAGLVWAQAPAGGASTTGNKSGGGNTNSGAASKGGTSAPANPVNTPLPTPPIYVSGKVVTEAGNAPPDVVQITGCGATANTSSKGEFTVGIPSGGRGETAFCDLSAFLPGYRPEIIHVNLHLLGSVGVSGIGTVVLRKLGPADPATVSVQSLKAPKQAQQAYNGGLKLLHERKAEEAAAEFRKAVAAYPQYAQAWTDLGYAYLLLSKKDEAREASMKAVEADRHLVQPHLQLSDIALQERDWAKLAEETGEVIRLDPASYPQAHFYNALANFNTKSYVLAETSALTTVELDTEHRYPMVNYLLGLMAAMKKEYSTAAQHLRLYLETVSDDEAEKVKAQLAEVETKLAATASH